MTTMTIYVNYSQQKQTNQRVDWWVHEYDKTGQVNDLVHLNLIATIAAKVR